MQRIRKNDLVMVVCGKDKGRTGKVKGFDGQDRVIVDRINMVKRHKKASQKSPGGIEEKEMGIHVSNVMVIDPKTKEPTRVKFQGSGREKKRIAVTSGEIIG